MLTSAIYVSAIAAVLILTAIDRKNLFYCYVFFVPWLGLNVDIGLMVTIDRIIAVGLLLVFLTQSNRVIPTALTVFFGFAVLDTALMSQFLPDFAATFDPARGTYRWIGQTVMWSLYLVPVLYIPTNWSPGLANRAALILVVSVSILCCLGLVQFAVFRASGIDIFPLGMFDPKASEAPVRTGMLYFQHGGNALLGHESIRISALGGEPKDLAYSIVVALDVLLVDAYLGNLLLISPIKKRLATALLLATLCLTFSTQGLALFALDLVVLVMAVQFFARGAKTFATVRLASGLLALVAIVYFTPGLLSVLSDRTIDRVAESGALEDYNQTVLEWLLDNPLYAIAGTGLGNVHFYATPYIPSEFWYYMGRTVFVAKSGALRVISELGVVGFSLFTWLVARPFLALWNARTPASPIARQCALLSMLVTANFMPSAAGPWYIFICLGLLYGSTERPLVPAREPKVARAIARSHVAREW